MDPTRVLASEGPSRDCSRGEWMPVPACGDLSPGGSMLYSPLTAVLAQWRDHLETEVCVWDYEKARHAVRRCAYNYALLPVELRADLDLALSSLSRAPEVYERIPEATRTPLMAQLAFLDGAISKMDLPAEAWDDVGFCCEVAHAFGVDAVPTDKITTEIMTAGLETLGERVFEIPGATIEMVCRACTSRKFVDAIPLELRTQQLFDALVARDPWKIALLPDEFKSEEACLAAVSDPLIGRDMVGHVPKERLTENIAHRAVRAGASLGAFDVALRTGRVCDAAVSLDPREARFIPVEKLTPELVENAVRAGASLRSFPREKRTREACLLAITSRRDEGMFVPDSVFTEKIARESVERGTSLFSLPERLRSLELSELAMLRAPAEARFAPREALTVGRVEDAARSGVSLSHFPRELINAEAATAAANRDPLEARFIPEQFLTVRRVRDAVKAGASLCSFPVRLRTRKNCEIALRQQPTEVRYVPPDFIKPEDVTRAVAAGALISEFKPEILTAEACAIALIRDPKGERGERAYIPTRLWDDMMRRVRAVHRGGERRRTGESALTQA